VRRTQRTPGYPGDPPRYVPVLFATFLSGIFGEVERAVPGITRLSFVDDNGWWADGKDNEAAAAKLSGAAAASID